MSLLREITASTILLMCALMTVIALEHIGPAERYSLRQRLPGFTMNAVGNMLTLGLAYPLGWVWSQLGVPMMLRVPLWPLLEPFGVIGYAAQVAALVAFADFLAYWRHRAEHAWFWRIHVAHHAPSELHAANDITHPLQAVTNVLFIAVPLSLVQIDGPGTPFFVAAIVIMSSMYIHSPVAWHLGPLRKVFVDNRYHRIHHSLDTRHFDKNFGIFLSVWDRLFGTAYDPAAEWPAVGVEGVMPPRTLKEYLEMPLTMGSRPVGSSNFESSGFDGRLDRAA